jgi:H+/Cl- antiporter ClcA
MAVPSALIAALASLVAGVALGPEAPLILLGVAVGGILFARRPEKVRKAMMFVGGAAAISAVFGNPFITGFMILEFVALGAVPAVMILPVFTALASGYLVTIGIWNIPGVSAHPLTVPGLPEYPNINPGDILVGLGVAVLAGIVALIARKGGEFVDHLSKKRSTPVLFGAAIVTAVVLAIAEGVFGINQDQILFSGNSGMPGLIAETSAGIVLVVIIAKTLTYSVALGGGFRGGPIFPVTFLGVAVGVLVALLVPGMNASAMAAAGIAAASAAFLKLPATSALLGALLIAGTGPAIAPFAIFGAVIGFVIRLIADSRQSKRIEP